MRYVVHCHRCSHGEFACDELRDDLRCPHCQAMPARYSVDGEDFCFLHRLPLSGRYDWSANFLMVAYVWRGRESAFPNAKLYEAAPGDPVWRTEGFCPQCQLAYDQFVDCYESD